MILRHALRCAHARTTTQLILLFALLMEGLIGCRPRTGIPALLSGRVIAESFASPVQLVSPPDHSGRLFIVDQVGLIWILVGGKRLDTPFLDIRHRLVQLMPFYDERGLLGLAFHPDFAQNGQFYVYYSAPLRAGLSPDKWDHTTHVSEFKVSARDGNRADPSSERIVLSIDKPGYNFEGGALAFGPDGFLYIGTGDSVHDPSTQAGVYAQNMDSLLGKILRIDVNITGTDVNAGSSAKQYHIPQGNPFMNSGARAEVFAYGFRNPYRIWFDEPSGMSEARLFVGDVGQAVMEEIDLVKAGGNYGWPIREGSTCFNASDWNKPLPHCKAAGLTDPIFEYPHGGKASAIVGGVLYRGTALPGLYGDYIFGDWGRGPQRLFAAYPPVDGTGLWNVQEIHVRLNNPEAGQLLGVAVDEDQQLYLLVKDPGVGPVGESGRIYHIVAP